VGHRIREARILLEGVAQDWRTQAPDSTRLMLLEPVQLAGRIMGGRSGAWSKQEAAGWSRLGFDLQVENAPSVRGTASNRFLQAAGSAEASRRFVAAAPKLARGRRDLPRLVGRRGRSGTRGPGSASPSGGRKTGRAKGTHVQRARDIGVSPTSLSWWRHRACDGSGLGGAARGARGNPAMCGGGGAVAGVILAFVRNSGFGDV